MTTNKKNKTREKIINYILKHKLTSKAELAKELDLSMPTVLSNVNELISKGIIIEVGEYESTGGRKAKRLGINDSYAKAVGVVISANHLEMVIINLKYEIEISKRIRLEFSTDLSYCTNVAKEINNFINENKQFNIIGIGFSIPGIINQDALMITKSHALNVSNYSLHGLKYAFDLPVYFENDANAAMLAEDIHSNALYLSLNNTLGGAFCIDDELVRGKNQKAAEFGHMILVPNGRKCYCGKLGCADAYCAASVLTNNNQISLESFINLVRDGNIDAVNKWEQYLDYLAIMIANLRMAYDMDIILGGDVGGILDDYMLTLSQKVMKYNNFDLDVSYLRKCSFDKKASAVGVAKYFFKDIC